MLEQPVLAASYVDSILTVQAACACAAGRWDDGSGLGWWPARLADDVGGLDFFQRLTPAAPSWAGLDAALDAAKAHDARRRDALGAGVVALRTVFWLGAEVEGALQERLRALKAAGRAPEDVLGSDVQLGETFDRRAFERFLEGLSNSEEPIVRPGGRELRNPPLQDPLRMVQRLASALLPLGNEYPVPFFRLSRA